MVLIYDKCYTIYALILNDSNIYSPSMPYTWTWATGTTGNTYPLGIFDTLKEAKTILKILFKTYPATTIKAIPFIKLQDKSKLLFFTKHYNILINHFYLESFITNKNSIGYTTPQLKQLFLQDKLA